MHDGEELVLVDGRSPDRAHWFERVDRAIIVEVHQRRAECLADLIAAMTVHALDEQLGGHARRMMRDVLASTSSCLHALSTKITAAHHHRVTCADTASHFPFCFAQQSV
jgi:hypothetical protein